MGTVVGEYAAVGGGSANRAMSKYASVGGGYRNKVNSRFSAIAGGSKNTVSGRFSFAVGLQGTAAADYTAAFALSGEECPVRTGNEFKICADSIIITNSDGETYDVSTLISSSRRTLEEQKNTAVTLSEMSKSVEENSKLQYVRALEFESLSKSMDMVAKLVLGMDYEK